MMWRPCVGRSCRTARLSIAPSDPRLVSIVPPAGWALHRCRSWQSDLLVPSVSGRTWLAGCGAQQRQRPTPAAPKRPKLSGEADIDQPSARRRPQRLGAGPGRRRPGRPRPPARLPASGAGVGGCWIGPMEVPSTRPARPEQRGRMRQGLNYLRVSSRRQVDKGFDEDGLSLPAQREACARYAADHAIAIVGEYIERGESARTADRPEFQAMLARIQRDRDVQVVVVHKVDRFARNLEDHVTVRALLRRLGVELVSVVEPLDDSPQGRLTEGLHALMAEFYSATLAAEIRKGMTQKAKQGGWPHQAPLGYRNVRKPVGGRLVACIEPDPDLAHHILAAFQLYASGDWTLERLTAELAVRGLCNRGRRDYPPKPLSLGGVAKLLANKTYMGLIDWNGVLVQGQHQPLISPELFQRVQDLLAARSARGIRERKHHHYLKGLLHCAVCGRRYSFLVATGKTGRRYPYFYCLGTRPAGQRGCREPHTPADRLERQVEQLYDRIQPPYHWLTE